jgi:predicted AAA+ superfamily ATPase
MELTRYLEVPIQADLAQKMVFVAGPRQVGKTTLARRLLRAAGSGVHLNWDNSSDRKEIRKAQWPGGKPLVALDEIHKWRPWKRWIKGEFDKHKDRVRFLVTGSARLDIYRRGGDSLQGRYHHYRLHPFSCAELEEGSLKPLPSPGTELSFPERSSPEKIATLMRFGGFPEPLLAQKERTLRRWQKERVDRFLREDIRDLESVRDLASVQLLVDLLPDKVGSPLSLNSIREDLEVSHRAVTHWMEVLERLYFVFRIRPFTTTRVRSLSKMPKAYLWDYSMVEDSAARFENLVASHLLKFCHLLEDREGYRIELRYLRDKTGKEVDFIVTVNRRPWFAVEAKLAATSVDPSLLYFRERLEIPWCYQVVLEGENDFVHNEVRCLPAHRFLAALV